MLMWRIGNAGAPMISDRKVSERGIAVEYAILGAFLVIQHELQRDPSAVRPARMRRLRAIAAEVTGIGHAEGLREDTGWTRGGFPWT